MLQLRSRVIVCAAFAIAALSSGVQANGQDAAGESKTAPPKREPEQTKTFFLKNVMSQNEMNDIQTALRNMLTHARIYGVASQDAISVKSTAEDLQQAQILITELDRPRNTYRVTYTVTDSENGKRIGAQKYLLIVATGNATDLRNGSRVPILVGKPKDESAAVAQMEYIDVGLNIRATISRSGLQTRFERSNVADQQPAAGIQDPVIHQDRVESTVPFTPGKPITLGSFEVPGSTHHEDIEALVELLQ